MKLRKEHELAVLSVCTLHEIEVFATQELMKIDDALEDGMIGYLDAKQLTGQKATLQRYIDRIRVHIVDRTQLGIW